MVRIRTTKTKAILLLLIPLFAASGCSQLLGVEEGLAPEDEPYLFDRWDPDFELAQPCQEVSDQTLADHGIERWENPYRVPDAEGLDSCSFKTTDQGVINMSGAAYKLAILEEGASPLDYAVDPKKQPALAFRYDEIDDYCRIAAETPRGTVAVGFNSSALDNLPVLEECQQAEKYFDLLIGEKLNEYRTN